MKYYFTAILLVLFASVTSSQEITKESIAKKTYRVIISSDFPPLDVIPVRAVKQGDPPEKCSDPDDVQSMVRFLLYSNELRSKTWQGMDGTIGTEKTSQEAHIDR